MKKIVRTSTSYGEMAYYKSDPTIGKSLELYGEYCDQEVELIKKHVTRRSFVLDVGANIGTHTLGIAPYVQLIMAIEPDPDNYALLKLNTDKCFSKNIKTSQLALGNDTAEVGTTFDYGKTRISSGNTVTCTTLDNIVFFAKTEMSTIDFIKIDAEGMEFPILLGAQQTLIHFKPKLLIEMQDASMNKVIYDLLDSLGYNMYWVTVPTYNPDNFKGNATNVFGKQHGVLNWFCSREHQSSMWQVTSNEDNIEKLVIRQRKSV